MKRAAAGFTLIELMLVLVLLATSAVAVVMTLPAPKNEVLKEESQRFYYLVQLLGEDAMLNGRDYGVRVDRQGYQFFELDPKGWQPLKDSRYFSEVTLPDTLGMEVKVGSDAWQDEDRLFEPGSLFDEDLFASEEDEKAKPPQIIVMSSGEYTPFTVSFDASGEGDIWTVEADEVGQLHLLEPGATREESGQ
ncbi:type II secretion system minor pseudopilin GspH [Photobacterium sp. 2_MG-2023]|uniref:Type II secretion system protein H n=1 Tax=Photobacterium arenosum TaxID=2774143 RepID=A0ABR9BQM9_9GAMM|nr:MULTISPECIES: type II secretion system minor pseudopilin GspH [Photobacterium]MBD8514848.1 type II secretion system minor pseudopilin GspH [Photobacterium arenosum]MBV7263541.1 type II secretion system minor pseudopilin GspH [Photobacterium sp. WH24]MDO6582417.1 type II secretion system minor pseudopilin GspH [Photobacterium sp. 2_MG-2023]